MCTCVVLTPSEPDDTDVLVWRCVTAAHASGIGHAPLLTQAPCTLGAEARRARRVLRKLGKRLFHLHWARSFRACQRVTIIMGVGVGVGVGVGAPCLRPVVPHTVTTQLHRRLHTTLSLTTLAIVYGLRMTDHTCERKRRHINEICQGRA